jgi:hypothetical protein
MNVKDVIIELAKYLNGDISDTNGIYESFFNRNKSNGFSPLDGVVQHMESVFSNLRKEKINKLDPHKHRCYNFQEGTHYVTVTSQGTTTKILIYK